MKGRIMQIDYQTAVRFLLPRHYSGRVPSITRADGWFDCEDYVDEHLKAVVTFGKPASPSLCVGICGKENAPRVYELNRLCRVEDWHEPLSTFVSAVLRYLRADDWIVVSYSDTAMNHHGYVYQACNFMYTGMTKERTDKWTPDGKHSRHYDKNVSNEYRKVRSAKFRYVFFCTFDKRLKKAWKQSLRYSILPYPKGDNNEDYALGTYLKDRVVRYDQEGE